MDIKILLSQEEIENRITELAKEIDSDYRNEEEIVVICILKGALFFSLDLVKKLKTPIILDTIHASSYVGTKSTGELNISDDIMCDITDKRVLIVEDLIDTGNTLHKIKKHIESKGPKDVKIAVLVDKKGRRVTDVPIDYVGFDIDDKFIIGYGFDYNEHYRNLPYIGYVDSDNFEE